MMVEHEPPSKTEERMEQGLSVDGMGQGTGDLESEAQIVLYNNKHCRGY